MALPDDGECKREVLSSSSVDLLLILSFVDDGTDDDAIASPNFDDEFVFASSALRSRFLKAPAIETEEEVVESPDLDLWCEGNGDLLSTAAGRIDVDDERTFDEGDEYDVDLEKGDEVVAVVGEEAEVADVEFLLVEPSFLVPPNLADEY